MADVDKTALDAAQARYAAERTKRLRVDGNEQYSELAGTFADFDTDPYVEPGFTRDPIVEETTAVIVGGGFAGMMTAVELKRLGMHDFRMIEKGGDFGGTWYWNRYPGCQCDVESYTYLPLLEETGFMPTKRYSSATEIFEYCQLIGRRFELYPHALFQTEIADAVWHDDEGRWLVTTSRGDEIRCKYFVTAGGILHKAKLPGIPGIDTFEGHAFHTSRWDYRYTGGSATEPMDKLRGKKVGIVGTGATAVQAVPQLAKYAEELYVFQRTPAAIGVRDNGPTDVEWFQSLQPGWHAERVENFTRCVTGEQPDVDLVKDGWTKVNWVNTQDASSPEQREELDIVDFEVMEEIRARVDEVIDDPETAEKLKPWYGKHCKRITFHDEYLPTFNLPHVRLVDTDGQGIERITPTGAVVDGEEYELDLIVFASGFEVTTDQHRRLGFDPAGRDGVRLSERWHDGAHSLHGVLSAEFPNLLMLGIVQAGFGTNFVHFLQNSARHVAWVIEHCEGAGINTIEATPEAEEGWLMELYMAVGGMPDYSGNCTPSYYNSEGNRGPKAARNLTYIGSLLDYDGFLQRWRADAAETGEYPGARTT